MTDKTTELIAKLKKIAAVMPWLGVFADALEAEHRDLRAQEKASKFWADTAVTYRAERYALRAAIQELLASRDMEWDLPPAALERLSRAIDTKEESND